ncbi:unnamed protein product [Orchesella dallaii]|uniref:Uncharacterized protein n=1 Tax=Orchesella dallaii TaxID=48710 RepID=A0ABP1RZ38_9HEXA
MFLLFSKKFLVLLLFVLTLVFEGDRHLVEGLSTCHSCDGDGAAHICDADHTNSDGLGVGCFDPENACYVRKYSDGRISKSCEEDPNKWKGPDGKPKCIKNQECYCNDKDFCNKDKSFGWMVDQVDLTT